MDAVDTERSDGTTTVRTTRVPRYAAPGSLDRVPTQRSGPTAPPAAPRRRVAAVLVGFGAVVVLVVGGAVVQQQRADAAEQQHAEQARTAQALAALSADATTRDDVATAGSAELTAARAAVTATTTAAVAHANDTLAAAPHVGDDLRGPLQSGIASVTAILGGSPASLAALRAGVSGLTTQDQTVAGAEQAWQAADAARVAAEQAAADQAAQAAAQAAAQQAARQSTRSTTRSPARSSAPAAGAPAAPAAGPVSIPAGGLVCPGAPTGTPGAETSVGAIGAAINDYRASNGLPALSVSRSGYLVGHAADMADAGGIWHSGADNIVGCISNGSASGLVGAWSRSPSHNAQMLRTDVSSMAVGGAGAGGWLYGAVKFS